MSDFTDSGESGPIAPSHEHTPGLISSASAPAHGRVSEVWADANDQANQPPPASADPESTASVELSAVECRVLGALIEKSYLTPDVYPMTTNGLVTASNQKTNRDPVVDYSAVLIDSTLMELRQRNLVRRVHAAGSRSTKHRQTLDEALSLTERQLVLLSVLLLRGPQTLGELRLRTERHDVGFDDLEAVESCLESLASRSTALVVQLARQPGHKEQRWQHLLGDGEAPEPAPKDPGRPASDGMATSPTASAPAAAADPGPGLHDRVRELEAQVATLRAQLADLAAKLGEPLV